MSSLLTDFNSGNSSSSVWGDESALCLFTAKIYKIVFGGLSKESLLQKAYSYKVMEKIPKMYIMSSLKGKSSSYSSISHFAAMDSGMEQLLTSRLSEDRPRPWYIIIKMNKKVQDPATSSSLYSLVGNISFAFSCEIA